MSAGVMGIQELFSVSAQKAHQLRMQLPPVNAPALILRFSHELSIPQVHQPLERWRIIFSHVLFNTPWCPCVKVSLRDRMLLPVDTDLHAKWIRA